ncbi:DNA damage-inducible protein D [Niabella ginsengisoli]|uniref:DNA damage-inducible protein D n=1 Tax=Niabella ginsengisoli TaxID=522298 RepID=A0ABS9SQR1_9BACT|nr:DNA damage-inducible protein D [Niabella ginsengisoli]MCH5600454.1 DNA damage-inducible protein D [Niabella ginsengisoli]
MKKEYIKELFEKFESSCYNFEGVECWSARELQIILGYSKWDNFKNVIDKARKSCEQAGEAIKNHFADIGKMVEIGSGVEKEIQDFALTRYACYLIAQNGDATTKIEIAFAQTYFAVQTRKQEIIERRLLDLARITAREKLSKSEKKLSGIIYERGVDEKSFALIRSKGDQALFGGKSTNDMKRMLKIPQSRPLADFLPTLTIKAKDFATELTSHNVIDKDLNGDSQISKEHIENNKAVRAMLKDRGVSPERLPIAEDVKKYKDVLRAKKRKF